MTACVFIGPTIAESDAAGILEATFRPPAQLGDVYRAVQQFAPRAVGIVDGYFQWTPPVWHKEILWAISRGVHVFGAASMGALRAAELTAFGMHGVGRIFEAYRDGVFPGPDDEPFEDDDEVAVAHGLPVNDYRGASDAMVNIRCTLTRAVTEGVISEGTRRSLVAEAKTRFFPDRSYAALLEYGRAGELPERELTALERWLPRGRVDQKRLDAVAMLERMREFLASEPQAAEPRFAFERTDFWVRAEAAFRRTAGFTAAPTPAELGLDPAACHRLSKSELREWFFANVLGVTAPADLDGWLREAGYANADAFDRDAFSEYLGREFVRGLP